MTKAAGGGGNRVGVNFHHDTDSPNNAYFPSAAVRRAVQVDWPVSVRCRPPPTPPGFTGSPRTHISAETCRHLWKCGFQALPLELWRQRGGVA